MSTWSNANPSRGAIKQTSHESDATDALGTGDGDASGVAVDGVVSGSVACSPSLSLLASSRGCRASVRLCAGYADRVTDLTPSSQLEFSVFNFCGAVAYVDFTLQITYIVLLNLFVQFLVVCV